MCWLSSGQQLTREVPLYKLLYTKLVTVEWIFLCWPNWSLLYSHREIKVRKAHYINSLYSLQIKIFSVSAVYKFFLSLCIINREMRKLVVSVYHLSITTKKWLELKLLKFWRPQTFTQRICPQINPEINWK